MIMYKNKDTGVVITKAQLFDMIKFIKNDRDYDSEYNQYKVIKRRFAKNY